MSLLIYNNHHDDDNNSNSDSNDETQNLINTEENASLIVHIEQEFKTCRYCLEYVEDDRKYCNCKGSHGYIHYDCLVRWYEFNNYKIIKCELCKTDFNIKVALDITRKSVFNLITLILNLVMIIGVNIIILYIVPHFIKNAKHYTKQLRALKYAVLIYSIGFSFILIGTYINNRKYTLIHTSSS